MVRGAVQPYARQWLVIRLCQLQPYRDLRDNRPRAPKNQGKSEVPHPAAIVGYSIKQEARIL